MHHAVILVLLLLMAVGAVYAFVTHVAFRPAPHNAETAFPEASRNQADPKRDRLPSPEIRVRQQKAEFMAEWGDRLTSDAEPISPYPVIGALLKVADRTRMQVTHDSGNPRDQVVPFLPLTPLGYLGWGKSTSLGNGLGLAMGAKLAKPEWLSVNFMGDSSFGMVGMDVETCVRCGILVLAIVFNNGRMGGYTRHHQVATRTHGINLQTGRYADVARALGAEGWAGEKFWFPNERCLARLVAPQLMVGDNPILEKHDDPLTHY